MFNRNCERPNQFALPEQGSFIDIDNNSGAIDIDLMQAQALNQNIGAPMQMGMASSPIMEPERVRVVHRSFEHVVPHMCPVKTRIINHHIFKHTYQPCFTCSEENVCEQVQCGSCCNF